MSGYEQVSALIDEGYGYYDMDDGFNNDIIGLHVANIDDLYEMNNVWTNESKTTISKQSDELKSDGSNVVTAESEGSTELVPLCVQEKGWAIRNNGNTNQNVQQTKPGIHEHDSFNVTKKEENQTQDPDFHSDRN